MTDFSVSDAGIAGLRLLKQKPLTVMAWGLFIFVAMVLPIVTLISLVGSHIWGVVESARVHGEDSEIVVREAFRAMAGVFLLIPVIIIASLIGRAMLISAVFRAVIEPKNSSFAYLRLGSQELWVLLVVLVSGLLLGVIMGVASVPVGLATAMLENGSGGGAALLVAWVGHIALFVLCIWLALRFSMAAPLSFVERRFALFESWDFTRGQAGRLFVMALLVVAVIILMEMIVGAVVVGGLVAAGLSIDIDEDSLRDFFSQPPQAWMGTVGLIAGGFGLLMALIAGVFSAVALAPWAAAYKALAEDFKPEPGVAGLTLNA